MGFGSAKDAGRRGRITADPSTPYVAQLANQLLTFSSMHDVEDLSADEMAELLLVMANAAEHLETQTGQLALAAHRRGVGRHLGSRSTGAWLAHRAKVTPAHAHRMIRRSETECALRAPRVVRLRLTTSRRCKLATSSGAMFRAQRETR
ncbi:MAG: hypothetical protein R2733_25835 [Acidimicrobiales bacterium]